MFDLELDEADSAAMAARRIAAYKPDAIVLDVLMPGIDGIEYCGALKSDPQTRNIPVILLTGSDVTQLGPTRADAILGKPFSPLELLSVVERLAGDLHSVPRRPARNGDHEEQLLLYANDLRHLLEIERRQRALLQAAYHDTVAALAGALESKDSGTHAHSQRVQSYAVELASVCAPDLLDDPSIEYGFLLHDVGKIGMPDELLQKPGRYSAAERRLIETHVVLGEQLLAGVSFMSKDCLVGRPLAPRAVGRQRLSGRPRPRADPARRARVRGRRHARRDHERPALSTRTDVGLRPGRDRRRSPGGSSTRRWSSALHERSARARRRFASRSTPRPSSRACRAARQIHSLPWISSSRRSSARSSR